MEGWGYAYVEIRMSTSRGVLPNRWGYAAGGRGRFCDARRPEHREDVYFSRGIA